MENPMHKSTLRGHETKWQEIVRLIQVNLTFTEASLWQDRTVGVTICRSRSLTVTVVTPVEGFLPENLQNCHSGDVKRELGLPHSKRKTQFISFFIIYCNVLKNIYCFITESLDAGEKVGLSPTEVENRQNIPNTRNL
jgi:hypothetical protein